MSVSITKALEQYGYDNTRPASCRVYRFMNSKSHMTNAFVGMLVEELDSATRQQIAASQMESDHVLVFRCNPASGIVEICSCGGSYVISQEENADSNRWLVEGENIMFEISQEEEDFSQTQKWNIFFEAFTGSFVGKC